MLHKRYIPVNELVDLDYYHINHIPTASKLLRFKNRFTDKKINVPS